MLHDTGFDSHFHLFFFYIATKYLATFLIHFAVRLDNCRDCSEFFDFDLGDFASKNKNWNCIEAISSNQNI